MSWTFLFLLFLPQLGFSKNIKNSENQNRNFIESFSNIYLSQLQYLDLSKLDTAKNLDSFFRLYNDLQLPRNPARLNVLGNYYREVISVATLNVFTRIAQNIIDSSFCGSDPCKGKNNADGWIDVAYLLRSQTDPSRFSEVVDKIYITIQHKNKNSTYLSTFPLSAIKGMDAKVAQKLGVFTEKLEKTTKNEKLATAFNQRLAASNEKECDLKNYKSLQSYIAEIKNSSPDCHFFHGRSSQRNCAPISLSFQKKPNFKLCVGYIHTATPISISNF